MEGDGIVRVGGGHAKDQKPQGVMWQSMPRMFCGNW